MNEATMTDADMKQREKIVKSMKKNFKDFRKRYGADAKNVMYATATKMAMKEAVDEADKGEYDYEGDMAKSSLRTIIRNAQMMHDMLGEDTNLPEWVQSKITLAEDYMVSAAQYMQSEMSEEVELEEGSYNPEPARQSSNKRMMKKGKAGRERNAQQYMKNMMLPRSQRKSAPTKGTDEYGNRFTKHVSGPYMGEEVQQVDEEEYDYQRDYRSGGATKSEYRSAVRSYQRKSARALEKKIPHAVHIDGKKWKSFSSQGHATNVAKKIIAKGGKQKITIHREDVEPINHHVKEETGQDRSDN